MKCKCLKSFRANVWVQNHPSSVGLRRFAECDPVSPEKRERGHYGEVPNH